MNLKSLIYGPDTRQALRIKRLFIAISTYFFVQLLATYALLHGLLPGIPYWMPLLISCVCNTTFYLLIRFNINLKLRDPSLTAPQMIVGTGCYMYLLYFSNEARGTFLMLYVLLLVFGIFKLQARQFLLVGMIAPLAYGALILFQPIDPSIRRNVVVDILQWLALVFVIPWFALVGGYISNARRKLRDSNAQLAKALREVEVAMHTIREQATHDELTGVYNRRYIMEALASEKARADRSGEVFCVLIMDIDYFKQINDRRGHAAGDRALVVFAQTVLAQLRAVDRFARFGGEEFLLLMPGATQAGVVTGAERIRAGVERVRCFAGADDADQAGITVSIGVAEYRLGESVEDILARADRALYAAKANGRNRVEFR